MNRILLVVDDIKTNREILKKILFDEYDFLEAVNGNDALTILRRDYKRISAVLLDLFMPGIDGYTVLECMRKDNELSQIPVIITTGQTEGSSEVRALRLGANDYVTKPYNSTIIRQRIHNIINQRETAVAINELQRDRLTGLYSRETFFKKAEELISQHEAGYYLMSCLDIDNFKVINDQYGTDTGDKVLKYVADCIQSFLTPEDGICCRISADNFAVLMRSTIDLEAVRLNNLKASKPPCINRSINIRIGRYQVNDLSLSANAMYDRALLAEMSVRGRYGKYVAVFDESMRDKLLREQEIVTEMNSALRNGQFEVWFQPQYNHSTGALIGAEALVRWRHPQKGLISPGEFIPVFEHNGFIYKLDKYVWEETCRFIKSCIEEGRTSLPVSVNVSRNDMLNDDIVEVITGLIKEYEIPVDQLRLEITESAFAESTSRIVDIVKKFVEYGFTVEIDDFGSGFSSLNTLKNVPAQVVKLDMRFLEDDNNSQRGGNIIESVVRMTKWLGMSLIAEGVEEKEQADFLRSIGCNYIQGFLYAKPMPLEEYRMLCGKSCKEEKLLVLQTVENLDNNTFWNPKSMDSLIFNSYIGGACIFEYCNGKIELLRANQKYAQVIGNAKMTVDDILALKIADYLDESSMNAVSNAVQQSINSGKEITDEYVFYNLPNCPQETYLRTTMRVVASTEDRHLVYCMSENITAQRQAEQMERKVTRQLHSVMDNVSCGITAASLKPDKAVYLLSNNMFYKLLGYTREQYLDEIGSNAFSTVYPIDKQYVMDAVKRTVQSGNATTLEYRCVRRDGRLIWLRSLISTTEFDDIDGKVLILTYTDVTFEKNVAKELLDNLPNGAALYEYDGETLKVIHINKRYWELVGRSNVEYAHNSVLDAIYPDDRECVIHELDSAVHSGNAISCDIRLRYGDNEYRSFHVTAKITEKGTGKYSVYASYTPASR